VPPYPAERDGALDPGSELLAAAARREKRFVDALDIDAAILHGFDAVRDLDDLARGGIGIGRCNRFASSHSARIQTSCSSAVVRITGIAFGWIGATIAFGAVVKKP